MKRSLLVFLLIMVIIFVSAPTVLAADTITAKPTSSTMLVNGEQVAFDAYNINNNNYFKLRDIAFILSDTEKQFEVEWDAVNNAIILTSGKPYTVVGGEMTGKGAADKTSTPTSSKIIMDGKDVSFTAYNIENNNYFKLRDIGEAFDFGVDWDSINNTIAVDTSKGYTSETPPAPTFNSITIRGVEYSTGVTSLNLTSIDNLANADIEPLKHMTNLTELDMSAKMGYISDKRLSDISVLKNLTKLASLNLSYNNISDITPLAGLTNLTALSLGGNQISDISALAGLTQLNWLSLSGNQITDISALKGLSNLKDLYCAENPISQEQLEELKTVLPNCNIAAN